MNSIKNDVNLKTNVTTAETVNKRTRRRTLVAPWKDVEEFNKVYSWIYGENASNETKKLACRQMIIWKIRRLNLTPAAVLATLVILEIQLKDDEMGTSSSADQMKDLQIFYSSAFTRFFNYMSSIMQTHNMKTMYETAKELNLRSFVVDLRHICAHGQAMPSLDVLRSTSKYCLRWLESFYWKSQSECMINVDTRNIRRKEQTKFEECVMRLFRFYDSTLECVLNHQDKVAKKYVKGEKYIALKAYFDKKNVADVTVLLGEIVKDLGAQIKHEKNMMDLTDIVIDAILRMRFFFRLVETHTITEDNIESVIRHTQGLFRLLAVYGLIEDLFHSFLAIIENKNEESQRRKASAFWANQLVLGFIAFRRCKEIYKIEKEQDPSVNYDLSSLNFDNTSKKVLQFYSRAGINVKQTLIFGDTVRRPWVWTFDREFIEERLRYANVYSIEILKNVLYLVHPQLTDDDIQTLKDLFDLNICIDQSDTDIEWNNDDDDENDCGTIYTADDVLKETGSIADDCAMKEVSGEGVQKYGVWSTAPECQDWYNCPIGRLLWD